MKKFAFKNLDIKKYLQLKIVKIFLASAVIIFVAGIIFCLYDFFSQEENQPVLVTTAVEEVAKNSEKVSEKPIENLLSIPANPFISNKEISERAAEKVAGKSEVKTVAQSQPTAPIELPQIPKVVMPTSTPVIVPPVQENRTIVNPLTMEEQKVSRDEGNVQGIITTDSGKNIAIMSNGEVLTEGERYLDGRIAYIGGDGIEMDNGKKIKLKE